MEKLLFVDENNDILNTVNTKFRLIIPTLNRPKELLANAKKTLLDLNRIDPSLDIQIVISENCSKPSKLINHLDFKRIFERYNSLNNLSVIFIQRKTRLSLGGHMHWLGNLHGAEWVMWLGDDDVLSPTYLNFVFNNIDKKNVMALAPECTGVTAKTFFNICNQDEEFEKPVFEIFSEKDINSFIIHRGHQLSGLIYKKEIIEKGNNIIPEKNLYPWIAYQILSLMKGEIYFLKGNHARITSDTPKLFSYGKDGLFPEICESIMAGFHCNYKLAIYYSISVLGNKRACWRIFKTTKIRIFSFFYFLLMILNPRMDTIVLLGLTPIIFYRIAISQIGQIKRRITV